MLDLRFNDVKIVQQPVCRWRDITAAAGCCCNVVVRQPERGNVVLHTRKKCGAARVIAIGAQRTHRLRCRQAAAVLFKALRAKKLCADGQLNMLNRAQQELSGKVTEFV